ncbi:MAG: S41 family peptidase [Anaerolineae bacterium]
MFHQLRNQIPKLQLAFMFAAVFAFGFLMGNQQSIANAQTRMGDLDEAFSIIEEAYAVIRARYVDADKVDVPTIIDGALNGMINALGDRFSSYETPEQYALSTQGLEGRVEGIGATVDTNADGNIYVVSVIRGAAAEAAGVLPGDIFWEVDGRSVVGISQEELVRLVRGPAGTQVTITFKRGDTFVTFTITRVRFEVPVVEIEVLDDNIGYLNLSQFTATAPQLVRNALDELRVNERRALIIDIRRNPGGLLQSVVEVTSIFKQSGVVLYEAFGDGTERTFNVNPAFYTGVNVPIVILTDEGSASASELFAGALQDAGLAFIIGETTFGKGTVQTVQPLSNGGALRLTIARWLTPNRNWINDIGIIPNLEVPYDPATDGVDIDPQLDAAIAYINSLSR